MAAPETTWEYHVQYTDATMPSDDLHKLSWHLCSHLQNSHFTNTYQRYFGARQASPVGLSPTVFMRSGFYGSSKYVLDYVTSLGGLNIRLILLQKEFQAMTIYNG